MRSKRSTLTLADRFRSMGGSQRQRSSPSRVHNAKGRTLSQRNTGPRYVPKSTPVRDAKDGFPTQRNRGPRKPSMPSKLYDGRPPGNQKRTKRRHRLR